MFGVVVKALVVLDYDGLDRGGVDMTVGSTVVLSNTITPLVPESHVWHTTAGITDSTANADLY